MADLWGDKIPIGVIYRNDGISSREIKDIFRKQITKEDIACQLNTRCVMMR